MTKTEEARIGDMHPKRELRLELQSDGDVVVTIEEGGFPVGYHDETGAFNRPTARVEFCVSGGRSRRTHRALLHLMEAMREDNREAPI